MINPTTKTPTVSSPVNLSTLEAIGFFLTNLVRDITRIFIDISNTVNALVDLVNGNGGPIILPSYVKSALPSAADNINGMIIVSNDVGGLTPAFSDGTNWRRTADRNVIS